MRTILLLTLLACTSIPLITCTCPILSCIEADVAMANLCYRADIEDNGAIRILKMKTCGGSTVCFMPEGEYAWVDSNL